MLNGRVGPKLLINAMVWPWRVSTQNTATKASTVNKRSQSRTCGLAKGNVHFPNSADIQPSKSAKE